MLRKKEKEHKPEKNEDFNRSYLKALIIAILINLIYFAQVICFFHSSFHYSSIAQTDSTKEIQDKDIISIGELEEKVFHQKFESDTKDTRLSKLEDFIFGKKFSGGAIPERINKLATALQIQKKEQAQTLPEPVPQISPEKVIEKATEETPKVVYDETFNVGILGTVSQLEKRVFNKVFNDVLFQSRIVALEDKLLSRVEISQNRKRPLLDRITILMQKVGIPSQKPEPLQLPQKNNPSNTPQAQNQNNFQNNPGPQNYTVDPTTGLLINEQTMETVKDNYGNPITVMIPKPIQTQNYGQPNYGLPYQQNPQQNLPPYGNPLQQNQYGGFPLDLLFNQQDPGTGNDPGY